MHVYSCIMSINQAAYWHCFSSKSLFDVQKMGMFVLKHTLKYYLVEKLAGHCELAIYFASTHRGMFWAKHGSSKLPCLAQNIPPHIPSNKLTNTIQNPNNTL